MLGLEYHCLYVEQRLGLSLGPKAPVTMLSGTFLFLSVEQCNKICVPQVTLQDSLTLTA